MQLGYLLDRRVYGYHEEAMKFRRFSEEFRMTTTMCRKALLVTAASALIGVSACDAPPTGGPVDTPAATVPQASLAAPPPGAVPETDPAKATERRISDITAINDAIRAFHAKYGKYPEGSNGLQSVVERGANWIPGLAPEFMAELPRDPVLAIDNAGPQYLYVSSATGYKVIAVSGNAGYCGPDVERLGIRIDPARINDAGCWAYGFWTDEFAEF
jgi:hypothetical protein